MPIKSGREALIRKGVTPITAVTEIGVSVAGSGQDITNRDSGGFVSYVDGVLSGRQVSMTIAGYEEDNVIRDLALGNEGNVFLSDITMQYADGDSISGSMVLQDYQYTGPHDNGETYTATLVSNGAWTHTKAP